jgi:alpha-L-fucosidase
VRETATLALSVCVLVLAVVANCFTAQAGEVTVAADGSGQFKSVQEAIMAGHPTSATNWWTVRIKPGTYKELIYVQRERGFLRLIGENATNTAITFDLHANLLGRDSKPIGTFRTPTAQLDADNIIAENLTFENSAGPVGQALAIRLDGDRLTFRNCRFLGCQDTIFANRGRHYFENCHIEGTVDFIFGAATSWFEGCDILCVRDGYVTAPSTPASQPFGFVFHGGTIRGASPEVKTFLGRPWRAFGSSIFLNTEMAEAVRPAGWNNWGDPSREKTTRFAEFGSKGPGANPAARSPWAKQLSEAEAKAISVQSVLGGSDGWNPTEAGRSASAAAEPPVYLFATFNEPATNGLRFAYSFDGYHWSNVPGILLAPHAGPSRLMRDPSLLRGPDGTFHLVWTTGWRGDQGFGYSSSKDLVHWLEQRFVPVMTNEPTTCNVWAPELFYDDRAQQFVIAWASTIPGRFLDGLEPRTNNHRMYFTTTSDFQSFAPAKLFLDPGFSLIDCQILKAASRYVLLLKDNTRPQRNLRVAFGDSPLGPWRDISPPFTAQFTEGPCALKLGEDWLIYYDAYQAHRYGAARTRDFKTFTDVSGEVSFPDGHKHGTALQITRKELDYLLRVGSEQRPGIRLPWVAKLSSAETAERLAKIDEVVARGPFRPDWDSLKGFRTPPWYQDAKLGVFIHWGAYSVPAFGSEWYPRDMYRTNAPEFAHHRATWGPQAKFGYKDFIPLFKAEKFDATAWATLLKEAGVKYVVPVAEHHDGFPMYASELTDWSAAKLGPKRDLLGELAAAFRIEGLVVGASSHRAEHWWFFDQGMYFDSDVRDTNFASLYGPANNKRTSENQSEPPDQAFLEDWLLRSCEIVDKYRPQLLYFDWWICQPVFQPYLKRFAAYYYNRGAEWKLPVAINFKRWEGESFPEGTGVFDVERGQCADIRPDFWQTCNSVSKTSWGYITNHSYKPVGDILDDFVDIVSKNGALLLNIGPRADGTIAEPEQETLRAIGRWLAVNGEAIYGTRPWKKFGEGPTAVAAGSFSDSQRAEFTAEDVRFTTKGSALYAIALAWPASGKLVVKSLPTAAGSVADVKLLGHDGPVKWTQTAAGLEVALPTKPPCEHAITLKITGSL